MKQETLETLVELRKKALQVGLENNLDLENSSLIYSIDELIMLVQEFDLDKDILTKLVQSMQKQINLLNKTHSTNM